MVLHHCIVVHLVDVVTGQDQHVIGIILLDEGHVLVDGVGGAAVPVAALDGLVGGQNEHAAVGQVQIPRSAGADVAVQLQGHILGQHAHGINTAVGAVGQREVDDAVLAAIGNGRLGNLLGQDAQTAALAASQQHGNALLLPHCEHPPVILSFLAKYWHESDAAGKRTYRRFAYPLAVIIS